MQIFSSVPVAAGKWERERERERERGVREEEEMVGLRQRRERMCFF
jgi:hypothetical protein